MRKSFKITNPAVLEHLRGAVQRAHKLIEGHEYDNSEHGLRSWLEQKRDLVFIACLEIRLGKDGLFERMHTKYVGKRNRRQLILQEISAVYGVDPDKLDEIAGQITKGLRHASSIRNWLQPGYAGTLPVLQELCQAFGVEFDARKDVVEEQRKRPLRSPKDPSLTSGPYVFAPPSTRFRGREAELRRLCNGLGGQEPLHCIQPVTGMPGMGTSQLARAFAQGCREGRSGYPWFQTIHEISGASTVELHRGLLAICRSLGGLGPTDILHPLAARDLAQGALAKNEPWLLVVNGLDEPEDARLIVGDGVERIRLLPVAQGGCILLTSCSAVFPNWLDVEEPIKLSFFPREVSVQILLEIAVGPDRQATHEEIMAANLIAERAFDLPLGIMQAAAQCDRRRAYSTLMDVVSFLGPSEGELQRDNPYGVPDYGMSVRQTSARAIMKLSERARSLADLLGWLAPAPVSAAMLVAILGEAGVQLEAPGQLEVSGQLEAGVEPGAAESWEKLFPLVDELQRQSLLTLVDQTEHQIMVNQVTAAATRSLPTLSELRESLLTWLRSAVACTPIPTAGKPLAIKEDRIGHLEALLEHADGFLVSAGERVALGLYLYYGYRWLGHYHQGMKMAQGSVEVAKACLEWSDPLRLMAHYAEAESMADIGDYQQAAVLHQETAALYAQAGVPLKDADRLASLQMTAKALARVGREQDALILNKRILGINCRKNGPYHEATIASLFFLADSYSSLGRYREALSLQLRTYRLHRHYREIGRRHLNTFACRYKVALAYEAVGQTIRAQKVLNRTSELYVTLPGVSEDHPYVLLCRAALGRCRVKNDEKERGCAELKHAYQRLEQTLGSEHPYSQAVAADLQRFCSQDNV